MPQTLALVPVLSLLVAVALGGALVGFLIARIHSSSALAAIAAQQRSRDERIGRLDAEAETAQAALIELREQRARADADAAQQQARAAELGRSHQELREKYAAAQSGNERLTDELRTSEQELHVLREQQRTVELAAAEVEAARQQLTQAQQEQHRLLEQKLQSLSEAVVAHGRTELLGAAEQQLGALNKPVAERLQQLDQNLRTLEGRRAEAETRISEQIAQMSSINEGVRQQAQALADALRKPQARGAWGEQHLRRTVELAGLVEHCDFDTQVTLTNEDGTFRPDLVVHLAGGKQVIVDAKVPLSAFLDAEAADGAARTECFQRHARLVRQHVDGLSKKEYQRRLPCTPEFVVLYLPGEGYLERALDADPQLMSYAADRRVLIATPTILLGMLRVIAFAWTQAALADNLREVSELGRELYERISTLGRHLERLGKSLENSVKAYNDAVGTVERRVLVSARRFQELKAAESDLPVLQPIPTGVRPLAATELVGYEDTASVRLGLTARRWLPDQAKPSATPPLGASPDEDTCG